MTEWRDIPGFNGLYRVSDAGVVWSNHKRGRIISPWLTHRGYRVVSLQTPRGTRKHKCAHVCVLEAFVGPRPTPGHDGRHLDGDRSNNRLSNLAWGTKRENKQDMRANGTYQEGDTHPRSKLSATAVREIRASALPHVRLAERYGVTPENIATVRARKTWAHVA